MAGASEAEYWEHSEKTEETYWTESKHQYFEGALSLLQPLSPSKDIIDIGGGVGHFAHVALQRGWDAYSFDISSVAAAEAAKRLGPERSLIELPTERRFSAATLWCVVAHTLEPKVVLSAAHRALAVGGHVWLTTPNWNFQRWYGAARAAVGRPIDFRADDHLGHFTPTALVRLLESVGFTDVQFHFRGITQQCVAARSSDTRLLSAKRRWNLVAHAARRRTSRIPYLVSELQVTARKAETATATTRSRHPSLSP